MSGPLSDKLKVMIVDDTITYRSILNKIVSAMPQTEVVNTANNGRIALEKLATTPADLVLLDIEMPEMDGLETLRHIRSKYPRVKVVMVSGMNRQSADITIQALQAGALDFIPKPDGDSASENENFLRDKLLPIMASVRRVLQIQKDREQVTQSSSAGSVSPPSASAGLTSSALPAPGISKPVQTQATSTESAVSRLTSLASRSIKPSKIDVIAIGVSTGGPNALLEIIPNLPANLGVPVVIVQHMPPVFTESLAKNLDKRSQLTVKEARDGEQLMPNTVYIAPGGYHMILKSNESNQIKVVTNEDPPENSCRPAVDVLFRSVANVYKKNILSIVLTGMGNDGAKGVQVIKNTATSSYCLTQSAPTCVVYGMPRAVDEMGLTDESVDLHELAKKIVQLVHKS